MRPGRWQPGRWQPSFDVRPQIGVERPLEVHRPPTIALPEARYRELKEASAQGDGTSGRRLTS